LSFSELLEAGIRGGKGLPVADADGPGEGAPGRQPGG